MVDNIVTPSVLNRYKSKATDTRGPVVKRLVMAEGISVQQFRSDMIKMLESDN